MRFLYPALILIVVAIVAITMLSGRADQDPKKTANNFLTAVEKGDFQETVQLFGGNTCRCPKKGGWVSYLVYASAQEPNLGFMMGKPFKYGALTVTPIKKKDNENGGPLPWQTPEDVVVDLDLTFDESQYMPMFLPLKMAYGIPMSKEEFDAFTKNPDKDCWQAFTLRLRPSLAPGTVARPDASKGIEYKPTEDAEEVAKNESLSLEDKKKYLMETAAQIRAANGIKDVPTPEKKETSKDVPKNTEKLNAPKPSPKESKKDDGDDSFIYAEFEQAIKETLGEEVAQYLHPKDAGPVKLADGSDMPVEDIAKALPRLQASKLRLHIVRREKLRQWTVYHFGMMYPVMKLQDGSTMELKSHRTPSQG